MEDEWGPVRQTEQGVLGAPRRDLDGDVGTAGFVLVRLTSVGVIVLFCDEGLGLGKGVMQRPKEIA